MQKVISKDGTTIAFDKSGQGPAVILVDGALCYRGFGPTGPLAALLRTINRGSSGHNYWCRS